MTHVEKMDYVLNLFKTNKMDMQLSTVRGLIPEKFKPELDNILNELVEKGLLDFSNNWWSCTIKGRTFQGFNNNGKIAQIGIK